MERDAGDGSQAGAVSTPPLRIKTWLKHLILFSLLSFFFKIPALLYLHQETDEIIYLTLARSLRERGTYSLQGTDILPRLSPTIYDHPLFHHPPLFPALLAVFSQEETLPYAITVPWIGHALAILGVGFVILAASRTSPTLLSASQPAVWLPFLAMTTDPVLLFVGRKLWIEGMLTGLLALSFGLLRLASQIRYRSLVLSLGGLFFGLAVLCKVSVLVLFPIFIMSIYFSGSKLSPRILPLISFIIPVLVLTAPWFITFYRYYGVFVPDWINPDPWSMERFPLMREWASRPWYFYLVKLPVLIPLIVVGALGALRQTRFWSDPRLILPLGWIATYLGFLTVLGAQGLGFQLRHLAVLSPAIVILIAELAMRRERDEAWVFIGVLATVVGAAQGLMYMLAPNFDDLKVMTDFLPQ